MFIAGSTFVLTFAMNVRNNDINIRFSGHSYTRKTQKLLFSGGWGSRTLYRLSHKLNEMFNDHWIKCLGPWNWPLRSPDITSFDFYL